MYGLVENDLKLIHTVAANRFELYDLANDPGETNNRAGTEPELLEKMKLSYQQLRATLELSADVYER